MQCFEIEGWIVELAAPLIVIRDDMRNLRFVSDDWNPNMACPIEDGLGWASAIASPESGLTLEGEDFVRMVRDVRENAPAGFADECLLVAEEEGCGERYCEACAAEQGALYSPAVLRAEAGVRAEADNPYDYYLMCKDNPEEL